MASLPMDDSAFTHLVLVVEDDPAIRAILQEILEYERYGVELASNGAEALASLRTGALSRVILLDLTMPILDGRAVYRALAESPQLRDHHSLLILSAVLADRVEFPLADAIMQKPFDIEDLLDTVERLCHQAA